MADSRAPTGLARRGRRLTEDETERRMLRAGLDMVNRTGLTVSLEHISFEDDIRDADVSRSSAYHRWPQKDSVPRRPGPARRAPEPDRQRTPRPGPGSARLTFETLATLVNATMLGLVMTALTVPGVAGHRTAAQPFDAAEAAQWSLPALGPGAIATAFLEPDPEFTWAPERAADVRDALGSPDLGTGPPGDEDSARRGDS